MTWRPTRFVRFIESLRGSTLAARIMTDQGEAVIKSINNPMGPHALVRDWVGTCLARWFGLPTFDYAIMSLDDGDEVPIGDGSEKAIPGPVFATRETRGHPWDGESESLKKLVNPEAMPRMVVFDTWILNPDRYPPSGLHWGPHLDNVFLSEEGVSRGHLKLIAMDHTECFHGVPLGASKGLATIDRVKDERLYGTFPEFKAWVVKRQLDAAQSRLKELKREDVFEIIAQVPREWEVSSSAREELASLTCERAGFLADRIADDILVHYNPGQLPF